MNYFVTAIGTDSGKTLVSAIVTEALQSDYWKPVQAGRPTDSETIAGLLSNQRSFIHPERYLLELPASPHMAADKEGLTIALDDFKLPETQNDLVIEGAGGCLVPLNNDGLMVIDLARHCNAEILLVADLYLGSINHTLLTVALLKEKKLPVKGIIFNGDSNPHSEAIILKLSGYKKLLHLPKEPKVDKTTVVHYAEQLKKQLK